MTSEQLKQTITNLQKVEREETNYIQFFLDNYKPTEKNSTCTILTTSTKEKVILINGIINIINTLKQFPFNKTIWCSTLFYPVDFHEDKILQYLSEQLIEQPTEIVLQALLSWIEECGVEFTEKSIQIMKEVITQIDSICTEEMKEIKELVKKIKTVIESIKSNENELSYKMRFDPAPISINGKSIVFPEWTASQSYPVNILGKDFLEYAEQLMICEYTYLKQLQPKDFYIYIFESTRPNSNIMIYLNWCQRVSNWVAYQIINQKNEMIREMAFKNFLQLAIKCLEIKNFNSFVSIIDGLKHYALTRMTKTMSQRTKEENILMEELNDIQGKLLYTPMSIEYGKQCVPCLKYFLGKMCEIFIEEYEIEYENENINDDDLLKMTDLSKAIKIGEIISIVREVVLTENTLTINPKTNDFFMNGLRHMKISHSDLLNLSRDSEK